MYTASCNWDGENNPKKPCLLNYRGWTSEGFETKCGSYQGEELRTSFSFFISLNNYFFFPQEESNVDIGASSKATSQLINRLWVVRFLGSEIRDGVKHQDLPEKENSCVL